MNSILMRALTLAVVGLTAIGATACSSAPSIQPSTAPPPIPSTSATPPPVDEPIDGLLVEAPRSGFTFVVPEGWLVANPAELSQIPVSEWPDVMTDLAERKGVDARTFIDQSLGSMELMAVGPLDAEYLDIVNVTPRPARTFINDDSLRAQAAAEGWTIVAIEQQPLAIGEAKVVTYTMEFSGVTAHGRLLNIVSKRRGTGGVIAVATASDAKTAELSDAILESLSLI